MIGNSRRNSGPPEDLPRPELSVVTDRLDGATFHGFLTESLLFGSLRLLVDIGVSAVFVTREISGSCLAAEIAVDALVIAVEGTGYILGIFIGYISHSVKMLKALSLNATVFFTALPKSLICSQFHS